MPPPPMPCSARAVINCGMFCAMLHNTDAPMKIAIADRYAGRRPRRSLILPHKAALTVVESMYAVMTQVIWCRPPKLSTRLGRAVATIV